MEFLQLAWVQPLLVLAGFAVTLWVVPNPVWAKILSWFGAKLVPVMNRMEDGLEGASNLATGAGLEGVGKALKAASDSVDELEDLPRLLVEYAEDNEIDAQELKSLIEEVGEAGVSVKVIVQKVVELIKSKKSDEE